MREQDQQHMQELQELQQTLERERREMAAQRLSGSASAPPTDHTRTGPTACRSTHTNDTVLHQVWNRVLWVLYLL